MSQEQEKKRKQKEEAKKKLEAEKVRSFGIHVRDDKQINVVYFPAKQRIKTALIFGFL